MQNQVFSICDPLSAKAGCELLRCVVDGNMHFFLFIIIIIVMTTIVVIMIIITILSRRQRNRQRRSDFDFTRVPASAQGKNCTGSLL
jgi:hypothetical protein